MLPDHNYAKRSRTENISDYEKLCKRFKITSINLELESTNEVPACPRSRDPSSETLPLLVREETQISISSDGLVLSPSLNEVNNNSQGSVSPGQQSVVSSSVSRSKYFYSQYFSCRNCWARSRRSQAKLLSLTLIQIRRPSSSYITHLL